MNLLTLPRIEVQNANALSSPFTIGFPAMTAWLGFMHALERKLHQTGFNDVLFHRLAVVSHKFDLQTHKGDGDFVHSIIGTANPLDKDGSRSAFIEEARCHLTVSLVIEYEDLREQLEQPGSTEKLTSILRTMKVAGGDILAIKKPRIAIKNQDDTAEVKKFVAGLMPGYVLIERRELMIEAMEQNEDALDAMLGYLTVNHTCEVTDEKAVSWQSKRKVPGWIVPIATGFQGISPLGKSKNQRDSETPHRFAESVVTLGEFVMAHKINAFDDMLWQYHVDLEKDLYLCEQNNQVENY